MNRRQIGLVEFSEKIYHLGLRHKGINGNLYEDIFIKFLREDLPQFSFYKGQILKDSFTSSQYDIIVCDKQTPHLEFLREVNPYINIVEEKHCLAVIELKKWGHPKMISNDGIIQISYKNFKSVFPNIKYFFVCLRFKDRKNFHGQTWLSLKNRLKTDGNFCFFGRTDVNDMEWITPWKEELINKNEAYFGEYERLLSLIAECKPY